MEKEPNRPNSERHTDNRRRRVRNRPNNSVQQTFRARSLEYCHHQTQASQEGQDPQTESVCHVK
jgi:hypothetical protein